MFSKYCNTNAEMEMIHWSHTSQVKQKPVNEAIFFFLPLPIPQNDSEYNQLYLTDTMLNPDNFHTADVALMNVSP